MNWHQHAARRRLSRSVSTSQGPEIIAYEAPADRAPGWVPRDRATWMPDIALGTPAERRAKAAAVTARLRATRGGA